MRSFRRGRAIPTPARAGLVAAQADAVALVQSKLRWPQHALHAAFMNFFPAEATEGLLFPNLEDLVNRAPFTAYSDYLEAKGLDPDKELPPTIMSEYRRGWRRAAEGEQKGDIFSAGGAEQIIGMGLSEDAHFREALRMAEEAAFPMDETGASELDLKFAAATTVGHLSELHTFRGECHQAVAALADRLQPASEHIRRAQVSHVAAVSATIHVALLAVAEILLGWPDVNLPRRFLTGFSSHGWVEKTGVLRQIQPKAPITRAELLQGADDVITALNARPQVAEEAAFLLSECEKDRVRGFGSG